ncbi:uncharacterized protein BX663DRAFT_340247 [Cokeromyces recurvatus]|uniref:uncharacterized protein n=1 Tax=Cokeromyces recurvatus TaxID=90255 RepID=UPI00221FFA16|nr:uncharacterized protein BX663DRAFT_340247 [Cokeromyces recurvatus]KAI7904367.1 hypothetical protein BX663DRAFT_340247 [Cokeromyces recurvatus]
MNTNPHALLPTTRLQSETDLASLFDSNLQILSLFHSSSTTTTNTSSSSPINSHYDDDDSLDTKKDESDSLINGNFLDFISYQDENLLPIINNDNKSQQHLQIQILGVPNKGAKSRVETQIKLCIQLRGENEKKVLNWSYIRLNENMIAKSRLRKNYQQSTLLLLDGSTMISDESKVLQLDAKVICASKSNTITDCHQQSIRMCMSCVRREVSKFFIYSLFKKKIQYILSSSSPS